jgi:hypothetical protein
MPYTWDSYKADTWQGSHRFRTKTEREGPEERERDTERDRKEEKEREKERKREDLARIKQRLLNRRNVHLCCQQ